MYNDDSFHSDDNDTDVNSNKDDAHSPSNKSNLKRSPTKGDITDGGGDSKSDIQSHSHSHSHTYSSNRLAAGAHSLQGAGAGAGGNAAGAGVDDRQLHSQRSTSDLEALPLYLRGGHDCAGFNGLLGQALALLLVARHGLTEAELWCLLATMKVRSCTWHLCVQL